MIRLNLAKNGRSWFDMSPAQLNTITQIYQNNTETAIEARAVLALTKGLEYERYPFDLQSVRSMSAPNQGTEKAMESLSAFKVYPNPSTDYAKVEINLRDEASGVELIVYNLLGAEMVKHTVINKAVLTINTADFNNGIYFFVLKTEKGIIEKQKIIVAK